MSLNLFVEILKEFDFLYQLLTCYFLDFRTYNPSTLASLPMIGIDDFDTTPPNCPPPNSTNHHNSTEKSPPRFALSDTEETAVGEISNSSSSSSDSDSDSDPDNTVINKVSKTNGHHSNGTSTSSTTRNSTHLLNEDLCLSESGSDSD